LNGKQASLQLKQAGLEFGFIFRVFTCACYAMFYGIPPNDRFLYISWLVTVMAAADVNSLQDLD
jgi:hypothetical protein